MRRVRKILESSSLAGECALLVTGLLAFGLVVVAPAAGRRAGVRAEVRDVGEAARAMAARVEAGAVGVVSVGNPALDGASEPLDRARARIARAQQRLAAVPSPEDLSSDLRRLAAARDLITVADEPFGPGAARRGRLEKRTRVSGRFEDVLAWLETLESSESFVTVEALDLRPAGPGIEQRGGDLAVEVRLSLASFASDDGSGSPAAESPR